MVDASTVAADTQVVRIAIAAALGLFLGLEREWSQKAAGIRTFALVSTLGAVFTLYDTATCAPSRVVCLPALTVAGAVFTTVLAAALMFSGLTRESQGLHLTTAVTILVAYGVGVLVGLGDVLPATVVAITSSVLLAFKRELHGFAWGLSRKELRSTIEFAILAFVVYPLLPAGTVDLLPGPASLAVEPRVVWLMVVSVAGIGIANYVVVQTYGGRGIAVTGFFGGLASSTAVVGSLIDHVGQREDATPYATAGILLANAAMALRNLVIALAFTVPIAALSGVVLPLLAVVAGSVAVAGLSADWRERVDIDLDSPFSMRNALGFGAMFLAVVVVGGLAQSTFGDVGFYATALLSGLVSSAGAATSAVVLYRSGELSANAATFAILLATASSIAVKAVLAATASNRAFARRTVTWTVATLLLGAAVAAVTGF
ncbi:MgtC/SapB family protein [Halocalculus aciditolerans]|uniref:MgtC/SapB transporter n=1 Tax=Halocalculus aciditolerans TaxID=1383812 RepID=A0A830F1F5_9EURY|nr:MgtC/SapB family protein [Halocalculus aciditolerans]GGL53131.1 hypothetical protein GCM10009039_09190 [Halocalculus aciditolerans]